MRQYMHNIRKGTKDFKRDKWFYLFTKLSSIQINMLADFICSGDPKNDQNHFVQYCQAAFGIKISKTIVKAVLKHYNITIKSTQFMPQGYWDSLEDIRCMQVITVHLLLQ